MGIYLNPSADGFASIMKTGDYVDKTGLITYMNAVLNSSRNMLCSSRPRRFGKTLALDMLKTFSEKTKEDTSVYFKDKQIWACGEKYQKMQGAFPVIFITFKDAKFSDWASTYAAIKNVIPMHRI